MSKKCNKCGETKELGEFGKDSRMAGGRVSGCKACATAARAARYIRDKAKENRLSSEYRKANREVILKREGKYRAENREEVNLRTKRWRKESGYSQAEYKEKKRKEYASYEQNRRAAILSASGDFTHQQWDSRLDYYGGKCVYCGSTEKIEIEHRIPLSRGGTNFPANLVPACKSCNCSKGTKTEKEFKQHLASKGN